MEINWYLCHKRDDACILFTFFHELNTNKKKFVPPMCSDKLDECGDAAASHLVIDETIPLLGEVVGYDMRIRIEIRFKWAENAGAGNNIAKIR